MFLFSALAADCPDGKPALAAVETALLEARVGDAERDLALATQSLLCGEATTKKQIARYWLLRGAVDHFAGRAVPAAEGFVAAYRADPTVHIQDFGKAFDEAVEVAVLEAPREFGRIRSEPALPDAEFRINGQAAEVPVELQVGAYALQFVDRDRIVFAEVVRLRPGVEHVLQTGLEARVVQTDLPIDPQPTRRTVPVMLIAGAVAGGLAAGSAGLYLRENTSLREAKDVDGLRAARDRQVGFGVAGATLAAVGVVGVGLHFAVR